MSSSVFIHHFKKQTTIVSTSQHCVRTRKGAFTGHTICSSTGTGLASLFTNKEQIPTEPEPFRLSYSVIACSEVGEIACPLSAKSHAQLPTTVSFIIFFCAFGISYNFFIKNADTPPWRLIPLPNSSDKQRLCSYHASPCHWSKLRLVKHLSLHQTQLSVLLPY